MFARITARQRIARRKNIAIARKHRKKTSAKPRKTNNQKMIDAFKRNKRRNPFKKKNPFVIRNPFK